MHDLRPLAPELPFPEYERNLYILGKLRDFERRRWFQAGRNTRMPRFVYRYIGDETSEKYLPHYLVESCLYLRSVRDFNDPFDMGAYITVNPDVKKKFKKIESILKIRNPELSWKKRREKARKIMLSGDHLTNIRATYEKSISDTGAICFTTEPRNLLMWSHYAAQHRGLVLQFKPANDIRTLLRLLEVEYSTAYPTLDWVEYTNENLNKALLTKHEEWKYEKEFRIIIVDAANTYLPFQPEAVTGLIFGCRADQKMRERVLSILESRAAKKLSPVMVYKAVKHPREYRVTIQKDVSLNWPS